MNKRTKRITLALIGTMLLEGILFFLSGGSLVEVGEAVYAFFCGEEFAWSSFLQGLFWSMAGFFLIGIISGPQDEFPKEKAEGKQEVTMTLPVDMTKLVEQAEEKEIDTEVRNDTKTKVDAEELRRRKERLKSGRLFGNK